MPSTSRRALLAGAVGGLAAAIGGGVAVQQYATRNHLRFRPLSTENDSDEPVNVAVSVIDESGDRDDTVHEVALAPTGDDGASAVLRGPSVSYPAPYAIRARRTDGSGSATDLSLSNAAIVGRLPEVAWGSEHVSLAVVVEPDGTLSARVEPRSSE
ncbi:hypothetical protein [Halorubrum sp. DTA46]|uniref:hypothetical protein n=1 Tax=Halorubrum sp. DTA46 TaxID=3402162 RepID=UPI003AABB365